MACNGKVFVSHAHKDNAYCDSLVAWLRYWRIDFWFDRLDMTIDHTLPNTIQRSLEDRHVLLRICTPAAQESFYCGLERDMFIGLMARDHKAAGPGTRKLINLIADPNYVIEPIDLAYPFIVGYGRPPTETLEELRSALLPASSVSENVRVAGRDKEVANESRPSAPHPPLPIPQLPGETQLRFQKPLPTRGGNDAAQARDDRLATFIDDDDGYEAWLAGHRRGYVLNCERHPKPTYLMLHRTSCHTISGVPTRDGGRPNVWTAAFMKVCSDDRGAIERWAQNMTGGSVRPCRFCKP